MVDKIDKQLRKLSSKQQKAFQKIITQIVSGQTKGLDILKLKGRDDIYRVRKGAFRIIFRKDKSDDVKIIAFENRSDTTYKFKF